MYSTKIAGAELQTQRSEEERKSRMLRKEAVCYVSLQPYSPLNGSNFDGRAGAKGFMSGRIWVESLRRWRAGRGRKGGWSSCYEKRNARRRAQSRSAYVGSTQVPLVMYVAVLDGCVGRISLGASANGKASRYGSVAHPTRFCGGGSWRVLQRRAWRLAALTVSGPPADRLPVGCWLVMF
jgi:hypothetical protein